MKKIPAFLQQNNIERTGYHLDGGNDKLVPAFGSTHIKLQPQHGKHDVLAN